MNAQQRLGRLIIALATLAGLAGFIANQIIFFQTHPTQAPEVYALTAIILVLVVLLGLLGGVLVTHGTHFVRRLPSPVRRASSADQQGISAPPANAVSPVSSPAAELHHTSTAPVLALSASVVILALAVILSVAMFITHPVGTSTPAGPAGPGSGQHTPSAMPTVAPTHTPSPTPLSSPTAAPSPSPASTAAPVPTTSPAPPRTIPSPAPPRTIPSPAPAGAAPRATP